MPKKKKVVTTNPILEPGTSVSKPIEPIITFAGMSKEQQAKILAKFVNPETADPNTVRWLQEVEGLLPPDVYESIRMMTDTHFTGKNTAPVGFTAKMDPKRIVLELITPDIGCGVTYFEIESLGDFNNEKANMVHEAIKEIYRKNNEAIASRRSFWDKEMEKFTDKPISHFGTLGGGNHFLEIGKTEEGKAAIFIHSGSRNFGGQIYQYYIKKRNEYYKNENEKKFKLEKAAITKSDDKKTITSRLNECKKRYANLKFDYLPLPEELSKEFLQDMELAMKFAEENRQIFGELILEKLGIKGSYKFTTTHNYFNRLDQIVRKGAVRTDEKFLIPFNVGDGVLQVTNKDGKKTKEENNSSSPHGLGRERSRTDFLKTDKLKKLKKYKEQTRHVKSMTITIHTVDECPDAYKKINKVIPESWLIDKNNTMFGSIYNFKENDYFLLKLALEQAIKEGDFKEVALIGERLKNLNQELKDLPKLKKPAEAKEAKKVLAQAEETKRDETLCDLRYLFIQGEQQEFVKSKLELEENQLLDNSRESFTRQFGESSDLFSEPTESLLPADSVKTEEAKKVEQVVQIKHTDTSEMSQSF